MKSANVQVEGYWPGLFAKLCEKRNVEDLITNVGGGMCRKLTRCDAVAFDSVLFAFSHNISSPFQNLFILIPQNLF